MHLTINDRDINIPPGVTILEAAQFHGIEIPTLCSHKDLTPWGACRICIVEVEGMRGFPTACTTPVTDGLVVRTQTPALLAQRSEILQLMMSQHPSTCLICGDNEKCRGGMETTRKAGVTVGCRTCPSDEQCEFQTLIQKMNISELTYFTHYRHLPVEKFDPFYDRDYNLCILCGRCVQVCNEVRLSHTLSFTERGHHIAIGPAFSRSHMDSGCEFCGACINVCPTGTLTEKVNKWVGNPDQKFISTCAFCGIGCGLNLLVKDNQVIGSLPEFGDPVSAGQLCVKGRFCIPEMVTSYQRLKKPLIISGKTSQNISWEKAVDLAAEKLAACPPDHFVMRVSPNCSCEELYIFQKFTRQVMQSNQINTTARQFYQYGFNEYLNLFSRAANLLDLPDASTILCVGLDTRFDRSVVGVALQKAITKGAKLFTIAPHPHNLSRDAELSILTSSLDEIAIFRALSVLSNGSPLPIQTDALAEDIKLDLEKISVSFGRSSKSLILIGSQYLQNVRSAFILESVLNIAQAVNGQILPLPSYNNLIGSLLMGCYSELEPGKICGNKKQEFTAGWFGSKKPSHPDEVLYLIGETPTPNSIFTIFQNILPPPSMDMVHLALPMAAFSEVEGTYINGEGRILRGRSAVRPLGEALPGWEIICRIAKKMGAQGFDFANESEIRSEISTLGEPLNKFSESSSEIFIPLTFHSSPLNDGQLVNIPTLDEHSYLGNRLVDRIPGFRKLFACESKNV